MVTVSILFLLSFYSVSCENLAQTEVSTNTTTCTDLSDEVCLKSLAECQELCGCDGIFIYDNKKEECVMNIEHLREMTKTMDHISADHDVINEEGMAKKLREANERVFRGLIGSALFVICCATACVITVCIFCCHMHISDEKLSNDIKALSAKLERTGKQGLLKKTLKKSQDKMEESCNVMVGDTDIMCV